MSVDSITLRQERAGLLNQCRAIVDAAGARPEDQRSLSGEEDANYKRLWKAQEDMQTRVSSMESLEAAERDMKNAVNTAVRGNAGDNPQGLAGQGGNLIIPATGMRGLGGQGVVTRELADGLPKYQLSEEYRSHFANFLKTGDETQLRSAMAGNVTQAGILAAPVQMVQTILKAMDNQVFVLNSATKFNLPTASKLQIPQLLDDPDEPDTVYELTSGSEDTSMDFGAQFLEPHPKGKSFKLSRDIIRMALIDIEAFACARLAYKFGIHWEKKMMLGTGNQEPLGLFTASANGIDTSRDISTGNTNTGPTFDGLKAAKYALREMYMQVASWIFHRNIMEYISKLKDGDGRYLLTDSVREGEPDVLLGRPVRLSEYAPNTNTTGQYVGIFGDYSYIWAAIAYDMEIVPLYETAFKTNQVEYFGRQSLDARPVLAEPFARVKNI